VPADPVQAAEVALAGRKHRIDLGASKTTPTSTWQASASPPGWPRCSRRS
jgi:hypothetical protein